MNKIKKDSEILIDERDLFKEMIFDPTQNDEKRANFWSKNQLIELKIIRISNTS